MTEENTMLSTSLSFDDLRRDVIDKGLCNKCGACVSFCTADQIGAIEMCGCDDNVPRYIDADKCFKCGICYLICPQTHELSEELTERFEWTPPIGNCRDVLYARATDERIREVATDGGAVTAMLAYMIENNVIDGAIVSKRMGLFDRKPEIAATVEDLIEAAGSQFSEASHLDEMGQRYSTYVPVLPAVRMFGPKRSIKLAVVGTPCQITAIRKMQVLNILPADIIYFTIGLFCMQCFDFSNLMEKKFVKEHNINPVDILKINVKDDFRLKMKSGITVHVPFDEIEDIARPACLTCRDFANDFADISVGGLGAPDGYTTVIIRSTLAKRIFTEAVNNGYIHLGDISDADKKGVLSLVKKYAERKHERAERILKGDVPGEGVGTDVDDAKKKGIESQPIINVQDLCAECEELNRHLSWVVGFVSHELSGTLGTIVMNISALADLQVSQRLSESKRKHMLLAALGSMKLMQDMIGNYLSSSKAKSGQLTFCPSKMDIIKEILVQVVRRLKPALNMKDMKFICDKCETLKVTCDGSLVRIAINNLINNAIKYGDANTTIHASLRKWRNGFEFNIVNEGLGIPEDKLDSVFDEFARFDPFGIGGTGLGLFLVKRISNMHNGDITADAGFIINDEFLTYDVLRRKAKQYRIEKDESKLRRFATFTLRIDGCTGTLNECN